MTYSHRFVKSILFLGYLFLYMPILCIVVYSFNISPILTVWGGFSMRWYRSLWTNSELLDSVWLSLKIGVFSATLATVLGTLCALALVRFKNMRGHSLLIVMSNAPIVLPEVILGLAFLLFFVNLEATIGWPVGRGTSTIIIAHTTLALSYSTAMIRTRLLSIDPRLEEAASDLGARPYTVFCSIILPHLLPTLMSSWLLCLIISLDDVVLASFTSGPGASTLPLFIMSALRRGMTPQVNALASLMIAGVALSVLISGIVLYRHRRQKI